MHNRHPSDTFPIRPARAEPSRPPRPYAVTVPPRSRRAGRVLGDHMSSSCLVSKLSHYVELSEADRALVATLEESERPHPRQADIYRPGDVQDRLYVVKSGWLFSYADMPDGRRQIVRIHHPGDIVGLPEISADRSVTGLRSVESGTLCPFPRANLDRIFTESPRLTALLFSLALREHVVLMDLLRANSRQSARERIAYMICELTARLRVTNPHMGDVLRLPLSQGEIADHLGLTNVYVSKTLTGLVQDRLVSRTEAGLRLIDEGALRVLADYSDRHARISTEWFPQGKQGGSS